MRFRVGDRILQNDPALTFSNGKNAIFDHCSFSWSTEENVNITDVDSVTLQWCINSESIYQSSHPKGPRAYAAQWGGEHASYHHNLLADHHNRMPRQNGNTSNDHHLTWDYRNNVHYNWGNDGAFYGGGIEEVTGFSHSNIINNYYKPGPATTTSKSSQYFCAPSGGRPAVLGEGNEYIYGYGLWYLSGNIMFDNPEKTNNNWAGLSGSTSHYATDTFDVAPITMTSADIAYNEVLANAGATKPKRDTFDRRVVYETQTGTATHGGVLGATCGIIDSHSTFMPVGEILETWEKSLYPLVRYTSMLVPLDTDADGIPDWWETANGLNPTDTLDGRAYSGDNSGYTNLEKYLNSDDVGKTGPTNINKVNYSKPMVSIYPNPVHNEFSLNSVLQPKNIGVFTQSGILIENFSNSLNNTYSLAHLDKGLYFIKITFRNGNSITLKVVKN
jgi:hypothetical protein